MHYSFTSLGGKKKKKLATKTFFFCKSRREREKKSNMSSSGQTFHLGWVYLRIYLRLGLFNLVQSSEDGFISQILLFFVPDSRWIHLKPQEKIWINKIK